MATAIGIQPLVSGPSPTTSPINHFPGQSVKQKQSARQTLQALKSGNGQRERKERPCDGCRRRKSKCVIEDTTPCVLCKFHDQDCTFVEAALPRKRKVDDGTTKDARPSKVAKQDGVASTTTNGQTSTQPSSIAKDKPEKVVPDDMAFLENTLSLQRHRHCRHVGRSSALDIALLNYCEPDELDEIHLNSGDIRKVAENVFFEMIPDSTYPVYDDDGQLLRQVESIVAPFGPALIDIYFSCVHPSFPILQKEVFLDRRHHGDRQFSSALLAAVYVLSLPFWSQDPTLSQHTRPSIDALEDIAFRSFAIAVERPKLSALQAGLMLLQKPQSNAWTLTVQLISLAQDLGVNLDCSTWSIPLWEKRLRKQVAWALFVQDKWSSFIHARPSHIQRTEWTVPPLELSDFSEEAIADEAIALSTDDDESADVHTVVFLQLIELTQILSEVIDVFYTQKAIAELDAAGRSSTSLILAKAKPVQLKLKEWFARLPAEARMETFDPEFTSVNGYLHLAYFSTEIAIHRRIVQSLDSASSSEYMMHICRSAAKTRLISALDFVNRLKPEHLGSFWYFMSANNFAVIATFGNLLRATAPGQEETLFYEMRLREYRWALSVSCKKAEWIEGAIRVLDVSNAVLRNLPVKASSAGNSPVESRAVVMD